MNWELISKDKNGETNIHFGYLCTIVVLVGFLFGLGFSLAYCVIDTIFYNEDWFVYKSIKENPMLILTTISSSMLSIFIAFFIIDYIKDKKEKKDDKKR